MKHSWKKQAAALALAALLLAGGIPIVRADPAEITISSAEELERFAEHCALDAWSQGKTVRLTADLDLGNQAFTPIPTFGGTFLGEGHKITGLHITAAGSNIGLFRYLQKGAVVQDLYVSGSVLPSGSAVNVGGIAGNNAGAIRNCNFHGTVAGVSAVGGAAGLNRESGEIARTLTFGAVSGEEFTGGTAGRNLGALLQCENDASVNTATPEQDVSVDMDSLTRPSQDTEEDDGGFLKSHSDTGGVVGWSGGVVYDCLNTGAVGYPHVGYNVGGVAGRQSGHLSGCTNRGQVYGRKDVGGIVGQSEPDVALSPDSDALDRLRRELDTLERLINQALDNTERSGDDVSARLSGMGLTTDEARGHTEDLLDHLSDFTDENLAVLNSLSARVTKALADLTPALDELSDVSGRLETLADQLEQALDALGGAAESGEDVSDDAVHAAEVFREAGSLLTAAVRDLRAAVEALRSAVIIQDPEAVNAALADLSQALETFVSAAEQAEQAIRALPEALGSFPDLDPVRTILRDQLAPALGDITRALRQTAQAFRTVAASTSLDWNQIRSALREAGTGLSGLGGASERLNSAVAALQTALEGLGRLSGRLGGAVRDLGDAAALAAPIGRGLERAFAILETAIESLTEEGAPQLVPLGEAAQDARQGLFDAMEDLSQDLKNLNAAVDSAGNRLTSDLRAISRQFSKVFQVLLDTLTDLREGSDSGSRELLSDTSDENIAATRLGKVEGCVNDGAVDGDRNVGGVIGTLSIEYGLDPEGDLTLSLGGTYETRAVLQNSRNYGPVTGKKDCVGGLAGRMDLGTALECENYGPVASTSGSYVGGVAGYAGGVVRESFAKCTLSGKDDVGGIAGWADRLRNCYAIATVLDGTERVGAIAGSGETETIDNNFFIDTGVAGIDGVSYAGAAEVISYEALRALPDIPAEFAAFTLTLRAEGKTVKEIPFIYGQDLSKLELPAVPEKEGFYGTWPDFDPSGRNSDITLEAVYTPWVTLVASKEREGKLALALAEGQFTEEAALQVQYSSQVLVDQVSSARPEEDTWDIILTGTDLGPEDQVPLRLLNRMDGKAEVRQYKDSQWVRLDARMNGSYLLVTMAGTSGTFQIVPAQGNGMLWLVPAAAVLVILLIVLRLKKRKKQKPAEAKTPAKT